MSFVFQASLASRGEAPLMCVPVGVSRNPSGRSAQCTYAWYGPLQRAASVLSWHRHVFFLRYFQNCKLDCAQRASRMRGWLLLELGCTAQNFLTDFFYTI